MTASTTDNTSFVLSGPALLADSHTLILDAAIAVIDGIIQACHQRSEILEQFPNLCEVHVDSCVLTPGFVNAHTHLELSFLAGKIPGPADFPNWVLQLIAAYPSVGDAEKVFSRSALAGAQESIRFGVTTVGDISRQYPIVRPALQRESPLGIVSFGELTALGRSRNYLDARLAAAINQQKTDHRMSIGLSPHAPYSVEGPALEKIVAAAREHHLPLSMHLAELREERDFLRDFSGPLGKSWMLMRQMDLLDDLIPAFDNGPIQWARYYGLFDAGVPVILAHVNYADDTELDILARSGAAVAYCPRTRHYFGHDAVTPHPWRAMRQRGISVCLATDSLASNPDLSLLREAQFLYREDPSIHSQILWRMITAEPAIALGLGSRIGRLAPGYAADIIALPLAKDVLASAATVCDYLVREAPLPQSVWIGGRQVSSACSLA
ncbi:MAG: amidohydrolase family protein [Phycisphaerae bacterium]